MLRKTCRECGKSKPITEFRSKYDKAKPNAKKSYCKKCENRIGQLRRDASPCQKSESGIHKTTGQTMLTNELIRAIQDGKYDVSLDAIERAVAIRKVIWQRETDADALSERRGAMREAMMESGTRTVAMRSQFNHGDRVRIKTSSSLRPRYLIGTPLIFLRSRVTNAEVRYATPDGSKFGRQPKFLCPLSHLEHCPG